MTWLGLLITLAITLRMTRLVVADALMEPFRGWVTDRFGGSSKTAIFFHCPWCVGWWIAVAAAVGSHWLDDTWGWQCFGTACAASYLTGLAAYWLDEE